MMEMVGDDDGGGVKSKAKHKSKNTLTVTPKALKNTRARSRR